MSSHNGGSAPSSGLKLRLAAQVIATHGAGEAAAKCSGSGYLVTENLVLTAAHVVRDPESGRDAASVLVRLFTPDRKEREFPARPVLVGEHSDIALLEIDPGSDVGGVPVVEGPPVRFARILRDTTEEKIACEAVGFPRFKLRRVSLPRDRDKLALIRDSCHARGSIAPGADLRGGTLEIGGIDEPAPDPEPNRSPWEGMSGAVVWSGGCIVGVISAHHLSEGLGRLTARSVEEWYETLEPEQITKLNELIRLPPEAHRLEEVPRSQPFPFDEGWLDSAAADLAWKVHAQWDQELRRQTVHGENALPVRFDIAADPSLYDQWWKIRKTAAWTTPGPLALSGRLDEIAGVYRSIPSERLVVLGEAGSGKTILALHFVLGRLENHGAGERVPVVFGLSSWNPKIALRDWMCRRLVLDYPALEAPAKNSKGNLADALIDRGRILPVLDGFDEIPSALQIKALAALNHYAKPLVLTSRLTEYATAVKAKGSAVLADAACVQLEALAIENIDAYLIPAEPRDSDERAAWEPVLRSCERGRTTPARPTSPRRSPPR